VKHRDTLLYIHYSSAVGSVPSAINSNVLLVTEICWLLQSTWDSGQLCIKSTLYKMFTI